MASSWKQRPRCQLGVLGKGTHRYIGAWVLAACGAHPSKCWIPYGCSQETQSATNPTVRNSPTTGCYSWSPRVIARVITGGSKGHHWWVIKNCTGCYSWSSLMGPGVIKNCIHFNCYVIVCMFSSDSNLIEQTSASYARVTQHLIFFKDWYGPKANHFGTQAIFSDRWCPSLDALSNCICQECHVPFPCIRTPYVFLIWSIVMWWKYLASAGRVPWEYQYYFAELRMTDT